MKNRILYYILSVIFILYGCSPMDYKYSDFIKDGPITYLTRLDESEVKGIGGRNRVRIVIPELDDPRASKVEIYWFNKREHLVEPIDPSKETNIYINDLVEATYIFELSITDAKGNSSIPVAITATSYGEIWESLLQNRLASSRERDGEKMIITYGVNVDQRLLGTEFEWKQDGVETALTAFIDSAETTGYLENFKASSFRYRSVYLPEPDSEDLFHSSWEYYLEVPDASEIEFDKATVTFTLPRPNDGFWSGYVFSWTDKVTGETKSQATDTNSITLNDYNGLAVTCRGVYEFDGVTVFSDGVELSTVRYVDLDRSNWYAAPETRISDSSPLNNNSEAQVVEKNKSPHLSHPLFYAASGTDAKITPWAHFDGNENTYLSIVKGFGKTYLDNRARTGVSHSYGGVSSDGNDLYFIIDFGEEESFNYFRLVYRSGQSNGNLKPRQVSFFGSNDPDCITDMDKWSVIEENLYLPGSELPSNSSDPNHPGRSTGNVTIPESSYRFLMLRYDEWTEASNSVAIAEFYLGLYY
ncbi:DUF4998 domain-containing protein [Proteiniphilum sp. UBA5384]|jgi:hypothetical protein|uniref:DUF4998 domain-containing protein n=1 Tax=Proteiniphilum sp. UBA5384 TaxID=1947279 RepID=UPI0025CE1EC5|nr:DUF4998 domain-containing protein [Proteiniphilum sp. UBA5384]